jgi:uncharacterized YigZ family protein
VSGATDARPATTPRVPAASVRTEHVARGSRFIADAGLTADVAAAKAFLAARRAEFPDASHHCHAFVIGHGASVTEGKSDDGEPSGTAGRPMLAVLRGSGLGDVTVVVTRYFGGTKLGTGGLVRAYTTATQEVLAALPTKAKIARVGARLRMDYALYEILRRVLEAHEASIEDERFEAAVTLHVRLPQARLAELEAAVAEASAGRVHVEPAG